MPTPNMPGRGSVERYWQLRLTGISEDIPKRRVLSKALPLERSTGLRLLHPPPSPPKAPVMTPMNLRIQNDAPQQNFGIPTPGSEATDLPSGVTVPVPITRHWLELGSGVADSS